ncbi:MAG: hypothetical protein LBM04_13180, partial [Opitutaceae bacterium]|nr:hypothetical protein [Opitutaceae bacterium]
RPFMPLILSIDFFAYDFPMTRLVQTNNPIATKNTLRGLASGLTKRHCVFSVINRAPIGAAVRLLENFTFAE